MKAQSVASAAGAGVLLAAGVSAEATFKVSQFPLSFGGCHDMSCCSQHIVEGRFRHQPPITSLSSARCFFLSIRST